MRAAAHIRSRSVKQLLAPLRFAAATNFVNQAATTLNISGATTVDIYDRIQFVVGAATPSLVVGESNWYIAHAAGITVPGNGYTIAEMYIVIGGVSAQVKWSGVTTVAVASGQNLLSDAIAAAAWSLGSSVPQGTTGEIRFRKTLSTPATDLYCNSASTALSAIESSTGGSRYVNPLKVNFTNGPSGTGNYTYSMINGGTDGIDAKNLPVHSRPYILGHHSNPSTGMWGDSKTYGVGDTPTTAFALGMNRLLYPNPTSTTGARSGCNFGNSSGVAADCTTAVGSATTAMLTYWYQYCNYAVVGYGTNAQTQSAQTALWAQIRAGGIAPIIQRSLTPRTTVPSLANTNLTRISTAITATVSSTSTLVSGNQYAIAGAAPSQYNGVFTITVVPTTTYTYTAGSTPGSSPASPLGTISSAWSLTTDQTVVAGWSSGGAADVFEAFLRNAVSSDPNMTYYQSQGERVATSGTNYWIWGVNGVPNYLTADGLHESAVAYELNIGTAGTATTLAGGTVSTSCRALVQAFV